MPIPYEYVVCTFCGTKMGPLATYCKVCGHQLPDSERAEYSVDPEEQAEHNEQICNQDMHMLLKHAPEAKHTFCTVCGKKL